LSLFVDMTISTPEVQRQCATRALCNHLNELMVEA
jgi:hypothetical protein